MNTPAHLIIGLAAFGKPGRPRVTAAALAGALLPDLSLYAMTAGALALGHSPRRIFDEFYFSDAWQSVFRIDNSVPLWLVVLGLGLWLRRGWVVALAGAALLHIASDLPLHHDDGRAHFWPFTDWVFASPFSYWDARRGAGWIAPLEVLLVLGLAIWCWRRFAGWPVRAVIAVAVLGELATGGFWGWLLT